MARDNAETFLIGNLIDKVDTWARDNATNAYRYGSMGSVWSSALAEGIVSEPEYQAVRRAYARVWDRAGD